MPATALTRRTALMGAVGVGAAAGLAKAAAAMDMRQLSPLAFQSHTMRTHLIRDFAGTLRVMRAMGFEAVELCHFPGFAGNPQFDFGPLGQLPPAQVKKIVADAGFKGTSAHFFPAALKPERFNQSIDWAKAAGLTHVVQAGLEVPARTGIEPLRRALADMDATGAKVRAAGLTLGFHTTADVWRNIEGVDATAEMMRILDPRNVAIQMDFGTIVQAGVNGAAIINKYPSRVWSVHIRDAKKPADTYAYLPAAPLGTGEVDWAAVLRASRAAGVKSYIVEMTRAPYGVFDAMKESHDYLRQLQI